MFKGLKRKISIIYGLLNGTISVTAIYYLLQPTVVFGGH